MSFPTRADKYKCFRVVDARRAAFENITQRYSVFLSYESSMCKTEMEHPQVPFSDVSLGGGRRVRACKNKFCGAEARKLEPKGMSAKVR